MRVPHQFQRARGGPSADPGTVVPFQVDRCHGIGGMYAGATNSVTGSNTATLLTDAANGDFSPKVGGPLATMPSLVPFDALGNLRGATSHVGAIA